MLVQGSYSRHKWKANRVRTQTGKEEEKRVARGAAWSISQGEVIGDGREDLGVREKNEVSARREPVVSVEVQRNQSTSSQ